MSFLEKTLAEVRRQLDPQRSSEDVRAKYVHTFGPATEAEINTAAKAWMREMRERERKIVLVVQGLFVGNPKQRSCCLTVWYLLHDCGNE